MSKSNDSRLRIIDATGLVLCLTLTAAMFFVAVQPVLDEQAEQREQESHLTEQQAQADQAGVSLSQMRQLLNETKKAVSDRPLTLQSLDQLNQRLAAVTALAGECELELNQIEPGKSVAQSHYVTVPIHLAGQGNFASAVAFLDRLHQDWPDLAVASLSLVGNPRTHGDTPAFTFELLWFASPKL